MTAPGVPKLAPEQLHYVEEVCDQFEALWKSARCPEERPRIEEYCPATENPVKGPLLRELLKLDLAYRSEIGEMPALEEYQQRFPEFAQLIGDIYRHVILPETRSPEVAAASGTPAMTIATGLGRHADALKLNEETLALVKAKLGPDHPDTIRELIEIQARVDNSRREVNPPSPSRLGDFSIVRRISHGGMGEIYEAVQDRLDRRVAIKIIRKGRIGSQFRERFLREQKVLARLHQTHIVPIHTAGEEGPLQYFAMPFIDGAALHHVIREARQLGLTQPGSRTPTLAQIAGKLAGNSRNRTDAANPATGPDVRPAPTTGSILVSEAAPGTCEESSSPATKTSAAALTRLTLSFD
jgi:hypothetical protein